MRKSESPSRTRGAGGASSEAHISFLLSSRNAPLHQIVLLTRHCCTNFFGCAMRFKEKMCVSILWLCVCIFVEKYSDKFSSIMQKNMMVGFSGQLLQMEITARVPISLCSDAQKILVLLNN